MAGVALSTHDRENIRVGIEIEKTVKRSPPTERAPSIISRALKFNGSLARYCATGQAPEQLRR